jgi:hypothetical protein
MGKIQQKKINDLFLLKIAIYLSLEASLKDIIATGEAVSPQKRTSSASEN